MIIREMKREEIYQAILLNEKCWKNDFEGIIPSGLYNAYDNYQNILKWLYDDTVEDIRKLYGAFINDEFVGFIGASFSETEDSIKGVEINYLFVENEYRHKTIGLQLIQTIVLDYSNYGKEELIVYSLKQSISNKFYRNLKPIILRQVKQVFGNKINTVDVFKWNIDNIKKHINEILETKLK